MESRGHAGAERHVGENISYSGREMPEHAAARGTAGGLLVGRVQDVKLSYCAAANEDGARIYNTLRGVYGEVPDLSHLRIWGCKTYLKMPENYHRKDWRDKAFTGYLIGTCVMCAPEQS